MSKQKYPQSSVGSTVDGIPVKKGRTSYSSVKLHAKRDRKAREAAARQREYDGLTLTQKIERVEARGGSKRELTRLLEKARNKAAKQAVDKTLKS